MEHPNTNMRRRWPSRVKPNEGDVFALQMPDGLYSFGRVVSTRASWVPGRPPEGPGVILAYVFAPRSADMEPARRDVQTDRFLIPPFFINRLPWSRGYFKTVATWTFEEGERLARHSFRHLNGRIYNERGDELPSTETPVAELTLDSFRTVDDAVSDALGIERVPD